MRVLRHLMRVLRHLRRDPIIFFDSIVIV